VGIVDPVEEGWDVMEADWVVSNHNRPYNVGVQVVVVAAAEVVRIVGHCVEGVVALVDEVEEVVEEAWDGIQPLLERCRKVHRRSAVPEVTVARILGPM
jgi:hypothetical protein